jgi:peptidyl-prolyl cis-trans isomerase B (cyclophilin B)
LFVNPSFGTVTAMNKVYMAVGGVIIILFGAILLVQGNSAKTTANPASVLPQDGTPTPVQTSDILKSTTPAPTDIPTPTPTSAPKPIAATKATISTSQGDIVLTLYPKDAPLTVDNFARKAQSGFYNGLIFHRVEDWVIQGGDPLGNGTGGKNDLQAEYNDRPFVPGSLGVARQSDPKVNNDSQFFITKADATSLNGQYTNFGMVTAGMDVVNKIAVGDKILKITVE